MPQCQVNAYVAMAKVPQGLAEIAKQLEIANRLKAIEIKTRFPNMLIEEDGKFVAAVAEDLLK